MTSPPVGIGKVQPPNSGRHTYLKVKLVAQKPKNREKYNEPIRPTKLTRNDILAQRDADYNTLQLEKIGK